MRFFLRDEGAWTAPDKCAHLSGSLLLATQLRSVARLPLAWSFAIAFGAGIAWELFFVSKWAGRHREGVSKRDLAADAVGSALGAVARLPMFAVLFLDFAFLGWLLWRFWGMFVRSIKED